jgi:formylglycine-generating enzyme required for sulfatase activity
MAMAIAQVLRKYGPPDGFEARLWQTVRDAQLLPERRLRAGLALALLTTRPPVEPWRDVAAPITRLILRDSAGNPAHFSTWVPGFAPVRTWLVGALSEAFSDLQLPENERLLAANILAEYEADNPPRLVELALQSSPKQLDVLAPRVAKHADKVRSDLVREAQVAAAAGLSEDQKDRLARRRANATLLLRSLGDEEHLWPKLAHDPDPRLRSFLLDHLYQIPGPTSDWLARLTDEPDAGIRQALILVLGSKAAPPQSVEQQAQLRDTLLRIFRDDSDPGVHSAAQWTLSELGCRSELDQAAGDLAQQGIREGFHWYVTKSGITMIIFDGPREALLGSPESEPGRDASNEKQWKCTIDWSFAISATEITQSQYLNVCPDYPEYLNEFAPGPSRPANAITWLDAHRFCRLLAERDGIPEMEMVVPPANELKRPEYGDFRARYGYRLPTEAEWEVACRAGTATPRFFGYADDLLPHYCCYIASSDGQSWEVATGWPNPAGAFDLLGNVGEWCYNAFVDHPESHKDPWSLARGFSRTHAYPIRGNEYSASGRMVRVANRKGVRPDDPNYSRGFRIAHTVRRPPPHP